MLSHPIIGDPVPKSPLGEMGYYNNSRSPREGNLLPDKPKKGTCLHVSTAQSPYRKFIGLQPSNYHKQFESAAFDVIEQRARDTALQEREVNTHQWMGGPTSKPTSLRNPSIYNTFKPDPGKNITAIDTPVPFFGRQKLTIHKCGSILLSTKTVRTLRAQRSSFKRFIVTINTKGS